MSSSVRLPMPNPSPSSLVEQVHVFLARRIEHRDLGLQIVDRVRLRLARACGSSQTSSTSACFARRPHRGLAGGEVHAFQRGLVAAHRGLQQRRRAGGFDADEAAWSANLPGRYLSRLTHLSPTRRQTPCRRRRSSSASLRLEIEVEVVAGELLRVLLDQHALAGGDVHFLEVVPFGTRSLRPTATTPGFFHDRPTISARTPL